MEFSEPKYFKQTRGDGSVYFLACVDYKTTWCFGLFSFTETLWCHEISNDDFALVSDYSYKFKTLDDARRGIHIAILQKKAEYLHDIIKSVEEIN